MVTRSPLYAIPSPLRPKLPYSSYFSAFCFFITFNLAIIFISLLQLIVYPLSSKCLPLTSHSIYKRIIQTTKSNFGLTTIWISQYFGPTEFIVTAGEGVKHDWIRKNNLGVFQRLELPERGVWMSNHQTLADWIYLWSFTYFANLHASVIIILKSSLKWIPFVGWACQFYSFIFVSRSWTSDKAPFLQGLKSVARGENASPNGKLALLIFPEGTLVTGNTRPHSKKFADSLNVPDLKHILLPRATGLFFALRTLARDLPDLHLIDLTISYPPPSPTTPQFQPPHYYPEDFYDPLSIWAAKIPPPSIHVHVRVWNAADIPLGILSKGVEEEEEEGTKEEQEIFARWLRKRWEEKDELIDIFLKEGHFPNRPDLSGVVRESSTIEGKQKDMETVLKLQLKSPVEHLAVFSYFVPVGLTYFVYLAWRSLSHS